MERVVCCVCEKPIEGQVITMGNRPYDAECHAKVMRNRQGLWWASLIGVGVLAVFVIVMALIFQTRPSLEGTGLVVVGVILALVPALIWMVIFYLQDVREPEPKQLVLAVFALGALLAQGIGIPLVDKVFRAPEWLPVSDLYNILGSILVIGFVQQFLIYAAVRYSVYNAAEFDERVDGIIYGTAAALGYATVINLQYVVDSGGVDLVFGIMRIVVTAMALASFGGLMGYFLGRCKFEDEPAWWMPVGLALAAILNGLFIYFRTKVTTATIEMTAGSQGFTAWPSLILGIVVAGVTFGFLFFLIRRLQKQSPQSAGI
jgi:RsiW-degrading membrane proteinase PrsW (M82 family)